MGRKGFAYGAAVTAALLAGPAGAVSTNVAGNTAEFLTVGAGGRALGMGDVGGPVVRGPDSMYWNPAGLAVSDRPEVSYAHSELNKFFRHDFLSYSHPVDFLRGTLGASLTMWTMDSLDARTASNVDVGKFSPHSEAFSIAYARNFWKDSDLPSRDREFFQDTYDMPYTPRPLHDEDALWQGALRFGVAFKVVNETIRTRHASAFALDGGAQFVPVQLPEMTLSMTFRNLGTRPVFVADRGALPMEGAFGVAYDVRWEGHRVTPCAELEIPVFGDIFAKLGAEYALQAGANTEVYFRGGYKTVAAPYLSAMAGATVGVGFRVNRFTADVGFQPMAELENVLRLSLGYRF
ncbi:MAG: hypothetical protein HY925_09080 [Elusimicrobia bacterium]|nr:hypothetical protein [Elusimicrobiota bacterium]